MLDPRKILAPFGGPSGIRRFYRDRGLDLHTSTAYAWIYRGSIPTKHLAIMSEIAAETGIPFSPFGDAK